MTGSLIDVWDLDTFDDALLTELQARADLIRDYMIIDRKNFHEREASDKRRPYSTNPHASSYQKFVEGVIMPAMKKRTIRAWHYTRLTDTEVTILQREGIYTSTLKTIQRRLNALVSTGLLSTQIAAALYATSPFHYQNDVRSNRFWMTSHPLSVDDGGVTPLLENWGGEGVYFWLGTAELISVVKTIGRPRVIETAVPLDATTHEYSAAKAVIATFARTLSCNLDREAFDLCSRRDLSLAAVLKVHTHGEPEFSILARGYPASFVHG